MRPRDVALGPHQMFNSYKKLLDFDYIYDRGGRARQSPETAKGRLRMCRRRPAVSKFDTSQF